MEDIKQIQEFFSKPLEENKVTKEDFDKVVKTLIKSKYPFTIMLVPKWDEIDIITGQDSPDEIVDDIGQRLDSAGLNWGGNSGITISGDSSNYSRREYSDIFRVNGGHKDYYEESVEEVTRYSGFNRNPEDPDSEKFEPTGSVAQFKEDLRALFGKFKGDLKNPEFIKGVAQVMVSWKPLLRNQLGEADLNDPVLMKMRAAKMKADKLAKMRAANAGDDGNDKFFDNAKKIAFLKKERERLMRDMEQEAEPEGGPIADEYGSKLNRIDAAIAKLSGRKEMTYDQAIAEGKGKMPTQDQVDKFFALTQNETHYLNSKPVAGQEATFNLMKIEPWDEYDLSNWNSLVRKAKQRGKSIDENDKASTIKDKIEKLRKLSNSGEIDGDEFLDKFNPLQKQLKSIDEDNSYARVSKPRFKKDKNNPNFLNVYLDYDLGPGGNSIAFGKETMTGQIRRLSSAKARKIAHDIALDLEANFDLEDIEVTDLENGKVRIFAVSDDFIDMDPNVLSESSKGAMNYFSDLKYNYQKAFRYLDVEEREEYKQLVKDFFSKLQVDDKVRAVGLEEAKEEDKIEFKKGNTVFDKHTKAKLKVTRIVKDRIYTVPFNFPGRAEEWYKAEDLTTKSFFTEQKEDKSVSENKTYAELNLPDYGKVTPPKGGASLAGQYNSIQGKSKYDTVIFDYQEGSDKPYGIVQVEGHGIYGSDLLKRLGLRQTKSWTAGVDVYIHDGNNNPVYVSEDDFKALLDFWSGGLDREAKAQADFYRGRGNTSGTIDEATEEEENEFHKDLDKLVHKTFGHSSDEKKKSMAQELAETIKLGEGVIEEELCPKGKAYIKRRKAAGEKSSAYLSGRAVKVCKGQMSGRKKKK